MCESYSPVATVSYLTSLDLVAEGKHGHCQAFMRSLAPAIEYRSALPTMYIV